MSDPALTLSALGAAFGIGLLGGPHCVGMCGGISVAMTPPGAVRPWLQPLWLATGRIATYAILGALGGVFGGLLVAGTGAFVGPLLRVALGVILVGVGVSIAGWWPRALAWLEALGDLVWRRLSPLMPRLLPIDTPLRALAAGSLWGFLPCGLVYAALAAATTSGSPAAGAAWMASFGLGTVPAVASAGWLAGGLRGWLGRAGVRRAAGALLVVSGIWTAALPVWSQFSPGSHGAHGTMLDETSDDHSGAHPHHID